MKQQFLTIFLFISILNCAQKQKYHRGLSDINNLSEQLNIITKGKKATVAYSALGIEKNFTLNNQNANLKMPMLSVFKFHLALAVVHLVDEGKLTLNQKIFIKKEDLHTNTWSPLRDKNPEGNYEISLADLIKYNVAQSDNNACDILFGLIGGTEYLQKFMNDRGVKNFQVKYNENDFRQKGYTSLYENYTTTKSIVKLLKEFYQGKIVSKNSTDFLMKIMEDTNTGMAKIPALLPNIKMARKTGSSGKMDNGLTVAENDAGILTLSNGNHFTLAVFIKDSMESEKTNTEIIAKISKIIYDYLNKKQ